MASVSETIVNLAARTAKLPREARRTPPYAGVPRTYTKVGTITNTLETWISARTERCRKEFTAHDFVNQVQLVGRTCRNCR